MRKPDGFYDEDPIRRTLEEIKQFSTKSKGENYCCVHQPLVHIPLDHIILDELHLMLRVTDVLINNLIEDAMQWDEKENFLAGKKNASLQCQHLNNLIQAINSCGVSFSVWEKRNADGKGSGTWDWTSLKGDDRKILLRELPGKMEPLIQQDTAKTVVELWKVHVLSVATTNNQRKLFFLYHDYPATCIFDLRLKQTKIPHSTIPALMKYYTVLCSNF